MKEINRQIVHIILGIILYFFVYYVRKRYLLPLMTTLLGIGIICRYFILKKYRIRILEKFLKKFGRPGEVGSGAMYFIFGSTISILFFPRETAALSILILGVADGMSTIIGAKTSHKVYGSKTLHGTMAFFITSFLLIIIINKQFFEALFVSLISSMVELFTPIDDNITIPPVTGLLLNLI